MENCLWQTSDKQKYLTSPKFRMATAESLGTEPEEVEAQIKSLRSQLLWLESSKLVRKLPSNYEASTNQDGMHSVECY